jgi:hypothetical protein
MTTQWLSAWMWKEFRALFPLWLVCAIPILARDLVQGYVLPMIATLAYGVGSIALGAQSVGHEFGYGTLGVLLAQPAGRRRIYAVKLAVLAAFLATLWLAASLTLFDEREFRSAAWSGAPLHLAPVITLCGLFLAPALTMASRSWLAGAVFTIAIPGLAWLALSLVGVARFGADAAGLIDRFAEAVFWPAMYVICAAAGIASWRLFGRLEVVDGAGTPVDLSRWWRGADARTPPARRSAAWRLALKELHLQQMPMVVAALYATVMLLLAIPGILEPGQRAHVVAPLTILYVLAITALVGALTSAEERQMGTLEWQLLAPVAIRRQWAIKLGVATLLASALALGLPLALSPIAPALKPATDELDALITLLVLLFAGSVYVSSLSTSGVRALLVALSATLMTAGLARWLLDAMYFALNRPGNYSVFRLYRANPHYRSLVPWMWLGLTVALVAGTLLLLAYWNHRYTNRPGRRVVMQMTLLAAIGLLTLTGGMLLGV